jgi:hypothetical protein
MKTRLMIAALVYTVVQGVSFGVGVILVLATPLAPLAMQLFPWVIVVSIVLAAPIAWLLAPRLQRRFWAAKGIPEAPLV